VILCAGLTPAWQQVLVFDTFTPSEVNRARQAHWCASGKVLNAARALHHLGAPCKALTLVGGPHGQDIRQEFVRLGIPARWVEGRAHTRVCTTIVDTGRHMATELVPNAAVQGVGECDAFAAAYTEEAVVAQVVVLLGSLPVGTPTAYYRQLLANTASKVILDARGPELLEALAARPFLVKPNRAELEHTVRRCLSTEADLFGAMRELNGRGAQWVVITDGGNPVYVSGGGGLYRLRPPPCEVVNPIGCGDCMASGIAYATLRGAEAVDAVRYGLAVAAAKVGQVLPGVVDAADVEAFAPSVEVTRL
jgi:1-phosphofructokinase family hexose kinase